MTDQEINIAIALEIGFTRNPLTGWWFNPFDNDGGEPEPPDYCNDLNAIVQAERTLNPGLSYNYAEHLAEVLGIELHIACFQDIYDMLVATPRQRAEAFLKTIGLGKE